MALADLTPDIAAPVRAPADVELPERASELTQRGEKLLAEGDYDAARRVLERAVGFAPDHPRIRHALGLAYAGLDNAGKAAANLRRSTSAAPDDLPGQVILGWAALSEDKTDEALRHFRTARKCSGFEPGNPWAAEALLGLTHALAETGRWQAALDAAATLNVWIDQHGRAYIDRERLESLVLAPAQLMRLRGGLLLRLRRYEEAAEVLERAFGRDRLDERTQRMLTAALVKMEAYERAEALLSELASEPAQRGQVAALTAQVCRAAGDAAVARRIWQAYRRANPTKLDASLAAALAETAVEVGGHGEAMAILRGVAEEMPASARIAQSLARLYAEKGEIKRGLEVLVAALAGGAENADRIAQAAREVAVHARSGLPRRLIDWAAADERAPAAAYYIAGVVAWQAGKPYLAATTFDKAAAAQADFLPAYEAWVDVLLATERYDQTRTVLKRLRDALGDEAVFTHFLEGKALLASRKCRSAEAALNRALQINARHTPSLLLLAWAMERQGRSDEASGRLMQELRQRPEDAALMRGLFRRLLERGGTDSALKLLSVLRKSSAPQAVVAEMTAAVYLRRGAIEQAVEAIEHFAAAGGDARDQAVLELWARANPTHWLVAKDEWVLLRRGLGELLDARPADRRGGRLLTTLLLLGGQFEQAADVMERLHRRCPEDLYIERRYVTALAAAERYEQVVRHAEGLLSENAQNMWALEQALGALDELKRTDRAVALVRSVIERADSEAVRNECRMRLLGVYEQAERPQEALEAVEEWLPTATQNLGRALRAMRLVLLVEAGRYDDAQAAADDWQKTGRSDGRVAWHILADALIEAEQYDRAVALLRERIEKTDREEDKDVLSQKLLLALGAAGHFNEADALAETWFTDQRYARQPRELLVAAYVQGDKPDEALAHVDAWLETLSGPAPETRPAGRDELRASLRVLATRLLVMQHRYAEAAARAEQYLADDADQVDLWVLRSTALGELGKVDPGMSALEKAYELDADDAMLNNNLGYYYADRGVKLDRAEAMIRKALAARPDEASFQDSLGWALYKQGKLRPSGRIFYALIASGRGGDHPVMLDHAGDVYYRLGWRQRAERMWRRAVEAADDEDEPMREVRVTREAAGRKLEALRAGRPVEVAPLGEGIETRAD
ncbi:MAG: tetratricopeptide repeat protein [Phycisphaerae bacterium]|nr:tetratricopeptide repeat protein [Phycisphaerae bacterium]